MLIRLITAALASEPLGSGEVVSISDDSSSGTIGRTAGIVFGSNGAYYKYLHDTPVEISKWLTPQTNMGNYEIKATLDSGDTPTGTFDTWEALSSTRSWTLVSSTVSETLTSTVTIEIRWTGNDVVQDTATYTLTATGPLTEGGGDGGNNDPGGGTEIV